MPKRNLITISLLLLVFNTQTRTPIPNTVVTAETAYIRALSFIFGIKLIITIVRITIPHENKAQKLWQIHAQTAKKSVIVILSD